MVWLNSFLCPWREANVYRSLRRIRYSCHRESRTLSRATDISYLKLNQFQLPGQKSAETGMKVAQSVGYLLASEIWSIIYPRPDPCGRVEYRKFVPRLRGYLCHSILPSSAIRSPLSRRRRRCIYPGSSIVSFVFRPFTGKLSPNSRIRGELPLRIITVQVLHFRRLITP